MDLFLLLLFPVEIQKVNFFNDNNKLNFTIFFEIDKDNNNKKQTIFDFMDEEDLVKLFFWL